MIPLSCILVLFSSCGGRDERSQIERKALDMTVLIGYQFMGYVAEYGDDVPLFSIEPQGLAPISHVLKLLADGNRSGLNPKNITFFGTDIDVLDPWGNEYIVAWQKSKPYIDQFGQRSSRVVFVWSFGPNEINEFGNGDDLSSLNGVSSKQWRSP